jgi:hypothetical protein
VIHQARQIGQIVDNFPLATRTGRAAAVVFSGAGAMINDLSYFLKRASDERTLALHARDPRVRKAHIEMAERYEERVRNMTAHHAPVQIPIAEHA